mmetsp:Transcript_44479/g.102650  ORF Transcript_44479/g.102650 Transcript_44479/m.102650 type:complete len:873 (-) Transcript_44479:29-2647(-)
MASEKGELERGSSIEDLSRPDRSSSRPRLGSRTSATAPLPWQVPQDSDVTRLSTKSGTVPASSEGVRRNNESVQSESRRSQRISSSARASLVPIARPGELGICFHTRAEADYESEGASTSDAFLDLVKHGRHRAKRLPSSLSTVFPDQGDRSTSMTLLDMMACGLGTTHSVRKMNRILKVSSILTAAYVLGNVAVVPTCVTASSGPLIKRITRRGNELGGAIALAHLALALLYVTVMIPLRIGASQAGTRGGDELLTAVNVTKVKFFGQGLWFDLLAFIGFIAELAHWFEDPPDGVPTAAQWIMLLELAKGWRVLWPEGSPPLGTFSFLQGLLRLFFLLGCFAHIFACILLVVGNQELSGGSASWITSLRALHGDEDDCFVVYTEAFYFASLSITSVGYGDLLVTPLERGINAIVLLLSQLFLAKVCADLTWLTTTHNHWEAQTESQRAQMWVALQHMQVPRVLAKRVLAYQNYMANVHRDDLSQPCFTGLSDNLLKELRLCSYQNLVMHAPFLREQPKEVIALIVGSLFDSIYLPADFIVCPGEKGRELFFMRRGEAAVYVGADPPAWNSSKCVTAYVTGNYFGELAMLTGRPRAAWVMARLYCVTSVLPYSAVEALIHDHPGAFTTLVQSMVKTFNLKPHMSWEGVVKILAKKHHFATLEEAFAFFRMHAPDTEYDDDELSAKAFDETLRRVKVPVLDRKIFWAEMDIDNSGCVNLGEFSQVMVAHGWHEHMPAPSESSMNQLPFVPMNSFMLRESSLRMVGMPSLVSARSMMLGEERTRKSVASLNSQDSEGGRADPQSAPASPLGPPSRIAKASPSSESGTLNGVSPPAAEIGTLQSFGAAEPGCGSMMLQVPHTGRPSVVTSRQGTS